MGNNGPIEVEVKAAAVEVGGESLKIAAGVQMQHVPYKGSAPALTDLIGGRTGRQ